MSVAIEMPRRFGPPAVLPVVLPTGEPGRWDCGSVSAWAEPVLWQGKAPLPYNGRATVHDGQPRYPEQALPEPAAGIGMAEMDPAILG